MIGVPVFRLAAAGHRRRSCCLAGAAARKLPTTTFCIPIQNTGPEVRSAVWSRARPIGVGPVTVPDYLDRPQIATRSSSSSLQFSEFDRWAEPLEKNLMRVLADQPLGPGTLGTGLLSTSRGQNPCRFYIR